MEHHQRSAYLEKPELAQVEHIITPSSRPSTGELKASSNAATDTEEYDLSVLNINEEEERRIWRKCDMHLMPILAILYLLSFMDRSAIGNARIEGLMTDLNLTSSQYNICLTTFFISYCVFEVPANIAMKLFRPSIWLPSLTFIWGGVMLATGFVESYTGLIMARFALGIAEAGLFPGVVYYLTMWYPRHKVQYRIGLFFAAATVAGAFTGLLAFGIGHMAGTAGLGGWSWIFIILGLITCAASVLAWFMLYDYPQTAKFLTEEERRYIITRKHHDAGKGGESSSFRWSYVWCAFTDWQIWLQILLYFGIITPLYSIGLSLPSFIQAFEFSRPTTQLLTVPVYAVACCNVVLFAHYSDKTKRRAPFAIAGLTLGLIGFTIAAAQDKAGPSYAGMFLAASGIYAAFPCIVAWVGNNLAPDLKRGAGMALHIGVGNFAGAFASNIYRARDAPRYYLGHVTVLGFISMGLVVAPLLWFLLDRINKKRDRQVAEEEILLTDEELRELGDRSPYFRYTC